MAAHYLPQEIIRKKRNGESLTDDEIRFFVDGITHDTVSEGQVAAFAMATLFKGMTIAERSALTLAMAHSGSTLSWPNLTGPVLDKHSSGGVGDKVSLMLGPMIAACGGYVPMLSGRGLGHTGGTLDKFDSIPGYNTNPSEDLFRRVVAECGCAIIGQTADLAPADRRFYGIRDITATVESIDLITASILSKKLAEGLTGLVMDIKVGTGAFMQSMEEARGLAESIVKVANYAGTKTVALITDMNQPLGTTVGNALEMAEAVDYLTGTYRETRLHEVTMALCSHMLVQGSLASDLETARAKLQDALDSGRASACFDKMVVLLGGPENFCATYQTHLKPAPIQEAVYAKGSGYIHAMDARAYGVALIELGGGRRLATDTVDHSVGFTEVKGLGAKVDAETPLAIIHAADPETLARAKGRIQAAITLSDTPPTATPVVHQIITG